MTQTEKKALPPGWEKKTLAEIISNENFRRGKSWVTKALAVEDGTIPIIFSGNLRNQKEIGGSGEPGAQLKTSEQKLRETISRQTRKTLRNEPLEETYPDLFAPAGSVLFAQARGRASSIGMYLNEDVKAVMNNAVLAMTPDDAVIHPELLFYYFKNPRIRERIKNELMPDGKPYVAIGDLKTLSINLPPRKQQNQMVQQIETLLSGAERVQSLLEKNQNVMDQLLGSALRDVFTAERKSAWQSGTLGGLVTIHNDQEDLRQPQYQDYPFVEAEDIDTTIASLQISPNRREDTPARGTVLGSDSEIIVFAETVAPDGIRTRRVAMPYYKLEHPPERLRCKDDLSILTVNDPEKLSPRFLFWALQDPNLAVPRVRRRSSRVGTNTKQQLLAPLTLHMPKLDEQKNISAYLDAYQEQLIQMKKSHQASQLAVDQMEGSILDQIFWEE